MRTRLLTVLPAVITVALAGLVAGCGGDDSSLPSGSFHHGGGPASTGGTPAASSGSGGSATGSSTGGGSSSGASGSTSSSTSSGGGGSGSTSGGGLTGSSGSGSGGASTSGGSSSGTQPPANLGVTVDQATLSVELLSSSAVHVSVAPNGYSGTVTLGTGTLPAGVTAAFDRSTLTLDGSTAGTATLTLTTDTSAPPGAVPLAVNATAGGATASTAVSVDVQSVITLHIPQGVNNTGATVSNPNTTAFGPYPITIMAPAGLSSQNPVTVYFKNDDTVSHEIHADAQAQGFGHDPGSFGAGQMDPYVRKVNTAGTYDFYLHDQKNQITIGRVFIQP